jgi:hypothetical protein
LNSVGDTVVDGGVYNIAVTVVNVVYDIAVTVVYDIGVTVVAVAAAIIVVVLILLQLGLPFQPSGKIVISSIIKCYNI